MAWNVRWWNADVLSQYQYSNLYINTTLTQLYKHLCFHFSHIEEMLLWITQFRKLNIGSTVRFPWIKSPTPSLSPPLVIFQLVAVSIPFPSGASLVWSVTNVHHSPLTLHTHCGMEGCREEIEKLKPWPWLLTSHFLNLFPLPVRLLWGCETLQ